MTKEELKLEAEELIQRFEMANSMNCFMQLTPDRKQIGEMLVMIAEPREKRIAELIALINAERKRQEKCDDVHLRKIAELEKENAELKADNSEWEKASDKWKSVYELTNNQLTKAKEIIKILLKYDRGQFFDDRRIYEKYMRTRGEAEQFISEVEK